MISDKFGLGFLFLYLRIYENYLPAHTFYVNKKVDNNFILPISQTF